MTMTASATERRYQSGFGNEYATEAVRRRVAAGPQQPAARALRPVPRADLGHRLHRAARTRTGAPGCTGASPRSSRPLPALRAAALDRPAPTASIALAARAAALGTRSRSDNADVDFVDGMHTLAANGDAEAQTGIAAHVYLANRSMERRAFVNADGEMLFVPQQGRLRDHHRDGRARRQARRDRAAAARRGASRSRCPTARRAATSARTTARSSACPSWARSAPTAWPTRATSRRRWRPSKTRRRRLRDGQEVRRPLLARADEAVALQRRRLARQPGAGEVRHRATS